MSQAVNRRDFVKNAAITGLATVGLTELGASIVSGLAGDENVALGLNRPFPLRPPGALPEAEFLARCIRCQRCADACPNNAIIPLDGAFGSKSRFTPHVQPRRQACMLCNRIPGDYLKCTEACPSGALRTVRKDVDDVRSKVAMGVAKIDEALCYSYNNWSCGACYRACPLPGVAMTLGMWERPEVVSDACIGCGGCERACIRYPQAIRVSPRGADA